MRLIGFALLAGSLVASAETRAASTWTDVAATAAAQGYCLARHPYIAAPPATAPYTTEGFEVTGSPGVVGAVRRNYVFDRGPTKPPTSDAGTNQKCKEACAEWGKNFGGAPYGGVPLQFRASPTATPMADGIGDMAVWAHPDWDFYLSKEITAGLSGRPLNYHESDVAQADYCCCHWILVPPSGGENASSKESKKR